MDLDVIKRGLRAEIKKRENEQYLTFQCNVRQMCKDVLVKLEEQESEIAELEDRLQAANEQIENLINSASSLMLSQDKVNDNKCAELRHSNYKRCLAMARWCSAELGMLVSTWESKIKYYKRWQKRWLELAEKFKPNNSTASDGKGKSIYAVGLPIWLFPIWSRKKKASRNKPAII